MSRRLFRSLVRLPGGRWLAPAWFDEARLMVQAPLFTRLLRDHALHGRVLNAGCGEGLYAPFVESFDGVRTICNIDVHPPSLHRRRAAARHLDAQGSLDALPFAAGSFDAVVCTEVLEHVPDDRAAVAELARVTRPGGVLLVSVPTPPAPFDRAHVREGYRRDELIGLLTAAGFEVAAAATCFHAVMRGLYRAWHWQQRLFERNLFPRGMLAVAAGADRLAPIGRPWDLAVVAVRRATAPAPAAPAAGTAATRSPA